MQELQASTPAPASPPPPVHMPHMKSDIEFTCRVLYAQVDAHNERLLEKAAVKGEDVVTVDREAAARTHIKRWAKFYGFTSKYDGKGNLREPIRV